MSELRHEPRDPITRKAHLNHDGAWVPCLLQDVSAQGFGIMCARSLSVGQIVELKCEPYPGKAFRCQIEIRYISDSFAGVLITEIDDAGRRLCAQLMADYHSDRKLANR